MKYRNYVHQAMLKIAEDQSSRFIGYGLYPNGANGTFRGISESKFIEMPVSENLMSGFASGLSIMGLTPVVYYERFDFILNALDAIVNHLDKLEILSNNQYKPTALIRCFVGGSNVPLYTGPTHTQDFTDALRRMVKFPVIRLSDEADPLGAISGAYDRVKHRVSSVMIIEQKEFL